MNSQALVSVLSLKSWVNGASVPSFVTVAFHYFAGEIFIDLFFRHLGPDMFREIRTFVMRVVYDVIPAVNIEMRMTGEMVVVAGVITVFQQHTAAAFEFLFPRSGR